MKKLGIYFMMLATMMAVTFVGCNKNEDEKNLTITMPSAIAVDLDNLEAFELAVAVIADEDLATLEVYVQAGDFKMPLPTDFTAAKGVDKWARTYYATDFPLDQIGQLVEGIELEFCVKATTATMDAFKSAPITISEPPVVVTPLEGPVAFTWHRDGSKKAEGLEAFGLDWPSNSTDFMVVITPLADCKLVQFETAQWTSITTQEDLKALVESGTALTDFRLIQAKDDTKTFNYVLGSRNKDGEYFLLNPTKREIKGDSDRYITGEYKH